MKPLKASLALLALLATMALTTTEARVPRFLQDKVAAAELAPNEEIPIVIAKPIAVPQEKRPIRGGIDYPGASYVSTKITYKPKNDLDFLRYATDLQISTVLPDNTPRLQTHIFTDKVVYRPNDVIFVEVLVVNAFNKTPTVMS